MRTRLSGRLLGAACCVATLSMAGEVILAEAPAPPPPSAAKAPLLDSLGDALPPGAIMRMGTRRFQHPSTVVELALSPDGTKVVTLGSDELIAWDRTTGKELWRTSTRRGPMSLSAASYGVRPLAFGAGSKHFYTSGEPNGFRVWDTATGTNQVTSFQTSQPPQVVGASTETKSIDVTRDETKFAVGGSNGVVVCDAEGSVLFEIENKPTEPLDFNSRDRLKFGGHYGYAVFSPDEQTLAVVTSDAPTAIRLHDATSGEEQRRIQLADRLVRMDFSPDGKYIVATERDIAVRQYVVATGEVTWSYKIDPPSNAESYTSAIAYSPLGDVIAVGAPLGPDYEIHVLKADDGKLVTELKGHQWKPWTLAFSDNGDTLFSSGWDGGVRQWNMRKLEQLPLPTGVRGTGVVAASEDGKRVAYVDDSGTVHVRDPRDGTLDRTLATPDARYTQLAFSDNGKWLGGGGTIDDQAHVIVWNAEDGSIRRQWEWPKGKDPHSQVECLEFSADGRYLAAAVFRQSAAYLWDLSSDETSRKLVHGEVYGLSFNASGDVLATAGWDHVVRFWNVANGELQREFDVNSSLANRNDNRMYTVCYSPLDEVLATAHMDGRVCLWDATTMQMLSEFQIAGSFVYGSMAFSSDGWLLATGSAGGAVQLWDPWVGEEVQAIGSHEHHVYTVGFGADGRTLVSGGSDGIAYLWDLQPTTLPPQEDMTRLWNELGGDAATAYRAMWAMRQQPEESTEFLADRLKKVSTVIGRDQLADDQANETQPNQNQPNEAGNRQKRLLTLLAEKDDRVALYPTLQRAIVALMQLNTPEAASVLQDLADNASADEVSQLASKALRRLEKRP